MRRHEIIDLIHSIESVVSINSLQVKGVSIWPLLRIVLAENLYKSDLSQIGARSLDKNRRITSIFDYFRKAAKDTLMAQANYSRFPQGGVDIVFLTHTTCRQYLNEYGWYDVFCDPYRDIFQAQNLTTASLEMCPRREYRTPTYRTSIFVQSMMNYGAAKCKVVNALSDFKSNQLLCQVNSIRELIAKRQGACDFFHNQNINYLIIKLFWLSQYFERLLTKLNPAVAFVVSYYSLEGMAFNLACRRQGILSIDIQHGMQGELHCAYAPWTDIPMDGYSLLPSKFWCWSDTEYTTISNWSANNLSSHRPIAGGNLWLNMWKNKTHSIVEFYDRIVLSIKPNYKYKKHILFTLQPISNPLPDWLLSTIKASESYACWWFRLHPSMIKNKDSIQSILDKYKIKEFELERATDIPLYAILRHMDMHVSQCSSTVLEASEFGVPSILIHVNGRDMFSQEIELGIASFACSQNDLIKNIREKLFSLEKSVIPSKFFDPHIAIQDIHKYIVQRKMRAY